MRSFRKLRPFAWLPLIVIFFGLRALGAYASTPLGPYDEGLLFTDAFLLRRGFAMYRDFHFCYPPGVVQIVRAVIALHLPAIWTVRVLTLLVRIASAVLAGRLVGRSQGHRFCPWTCAAVLVLQSGLGLVLFAYPVAILLGLALIATLPHPGSPRWRYFVSGILLAGVSYLRIDLFVYVCGLLAPMELLWWFLRRESFFAGSLARQRDFLMGLLATVLVLWLPVIIQSGISRPLHDLVLDLSQKIMPGRKLPIPPFDEIVEVSHLNLRLSAWLVEPTRLGLLLGVTAGVIATFALLSRAGRVWRSALPAEVTPALRTLALLVAFSLSTLPQALRRFDYFHVAYGFPVTIALLVIAGGARLREPVLLLALLTWFFGPPALLRMDGLKDLWSNHSDVRFAHPDRLEVARFVAGETRPDEPFFSACYSHRITMASNLDLHYLAKRPGATQYMIFDPGTTNSVQGQTEMVADLERTRPKIVVRGPGCAWYEPNDSQKEGPTLLDDYLAAHYALERNIGPWAIWRPVAPH